MITKTDLMWRIADLEMFNASFEEQIKDLEDRVKKLEKASKTKKVTKKVK